MTKDSLEDMSGLGYGLAEIDGQSLKLSPLRLRDIIALGQYSNDRVNLEIQSYAVFLHLRDNPDITLDYVLDLTMAKMKILNDEIEKLYPKSEGDGGDTSNP